jgi:ABC-type nitrate/sulfonate/bicarbonate transport system ATPase subunit
MPAAHLSVDGISHTYKRGQVRALDNLSFQVEPREALALVGRSGCGKSTLLHIMAGLMTPTSGKTLIDGRTVSGPSPDWVMMFQKPSLYPWMTVAQNVALGLKFTGRRAEIAKRVPEMLELVELAEYADRNVQDLSGGQQQRVALARSLAPNPEVLFLDEPFSALDAFTRNNLQRDVRRIAKDLDITLVLVTHDLSEAIIMAERAVVLSANPGRISDIVDIDLDNRNDLRTPEYLAARAKLTKAYEKAAGLDFEAGHASASPSRSPAEMNMPPAAADRAAAI